MKADELRDAIQQLRKALEEKLDEGKSHFAYHLTYINAYDELEELCKKAVNSLPN